MAESLANRTSTAPSEPRTEHLVGVGCGCGCDDLRVTLRDGRLGGVELLDVSTNCSACEAWIRRAFASQFVDCPSDSASLETSLDAAARMLRTARSPFITGLVGCGTNTAKAALDIADRLGATIDPLLESSHRAAILAAQNVGQSTCTLGEVRDRADLILFWGCDPAASHPTFLDRFATQGRMPGRELPRAERHWCVIDDRATRTAELADEHLAVAPNSAEEVLGVLEELSRELGGEKQSLAASAGTGNAVAIGEQQDTDDGRLVAGVEWHRWRKLFQRITSCRYGVVIFGEPRFSGVGEQLARREGFFPIGGEPPHSVPRNHLQSLAEKPGIERETTCFTDASEVVRQQRRILERLLRLATRWNTAARWSTLRLGEAGAAVPVFSWRTGAPCSVSFASGGPRFDPWSYSAEAVLGSKNSDVCLLIGSAGLGQLSSLAKRHLGQTPVVWLDDGPSPDHPSHDSLITVEDSHPIVRIPVRGELLAQRATVFRMDEVPLTVPPLSCFAGMDSPLANIRAAGVPNDSGSPNATDTRNEPETPFARIASMRPTLSDALAGLLRRLSP